MPTRLFLLFALLGLLPACGRGGTGPSDADVPDGSTGCVDQPDGKACGLDRICLAGACQDSVCGDGYVDPAIGEECEDGNLQSGDGCELDCKFSCHEDADCANETVCDGVEKCVEIGGVKRCQAGTALDCTPTDGTASPCTDYICDPVDGCDPANFTTVIVCYRDEDGDGYPLEADTAGTVTEECACPAEYIRKRQDALWDCNDARADVMPGRVAYDALPHCPGQAEPGEANDCTGGEPECPAFVCANAATPSFDFDCDGEEQPRYTATGAVCANDGILGCRGSGWKDASAPACGLEATWVQCTMSVLCSGTESERAQECR